MGLYIPASKRLPPGCKAEEQTLVQQAKKGRKRPAVHPSPPRPWRSGRSRPPEELGRKPAGCAAREVEMLLLDLAIWVIPVTLVLVPCRRLVVLVARLLVLLLGLQ